MGLIFFVLLFMSAAFANLEMADNHNQDIGIQDDDKCEELFQESALGNLADINQVLKQKPLVPATPYYFYLETSELEDLQAFKNCIDYSQCGKYQESIVDDPKNFRMHIWKDMTESDLSELVKSCPVKDLNKKLVVRKNGQTGAPVTVKNIAPNELQQKLLMYDASPAMFYGPNESESKKMVEVIRSTIKMNKVETAHQLILSTWNINLHGYSLSFTGQKGSFAVTNHKEKTIKYGNDWLSEPCDYIRMIRHEAEHVAQMKMSNSCFGNHNFSDHMKRERAAHLNDARFMKNVCGTLKDGETVRQFCLDRFRKNYMNNKK